jgi:hypothetical protein
MKGTSIQAVAIDQSVLALLRQKRNSCRELLQPPTSSNRHQHHISDLRTAGSLSLLGSSAASRWCSWLPLLAGSRQQQQPYLSHQWVCWCQEDHCLLSFLDGWQALLNDFSSNKGFARTW